MSSLDAIDEEKLAKDTPELTNLSTWMLIVDNPDLEAKLLPKVGSLSIPIMMKLSCFGTDIDIAKYTNSTAKDLIEQIMNLSGL